MNRINIGRLSASAAIIAVLAFAAAAQKPRSTPKPLATPLPVLTGAEIISRAGDVREVEPASTDKSSLAKPDENSGPGMKELYERIKVLEGEKKSDYDEKKKRMLLNLDILTRAEQRSESLRKQMFELIEKENAVRSRLDQIDFDIRPEMIERTLQMAGSMRPEEIRENRRKSLQTEKNNLQSLLSEISSAKASISSTLDKSEQLVEKLRTKLEKDIDDALSEPDKPLDQ